MLEKIFGKKKDKTMSKDTAVATEAAETEEIEAEVFIKPLANRVLVVEFSKPEQTKGGLYLPASAQGGGAMNEVKFGVVIAVGPGRINSMKPDELIPCTVKEGDHVAYGAFVGTAFSKKQVNYRVIWDSELIGILQDYNPTTAFAE